MVVTSGHVCQVGAVKQLCVLKLLTSAAKFPLTAAAPSVQFESCRVWPRAVFAARPGSQNLGLHARTMLMPVPRRSRRSRHSPLDLCVRALFLFCSLCIKRRPLTEPAPQPRILYSRKHGKTGSEKEEGRHFYLPDREVNLGSEPVALCLLNGPHCY